MAKVRRALRNNHRVLMAGQTTTVGSGLCFSFSTEEAAKGLHLPLLREGEVVDGVVIVDND
jgi:hypothetical protein